MVAHTRRTFIQTLGLGSAAALLARPNPLSAATAGRRIAQINIHPMVYPVVGTFKFFEDPGSGEAGRAAAIVKITADDGAVGWGESIPSRMWSYETLETVTTTLRT